VIGLQFNGLWILHNEERLSDLRQEEILEYEVHGSGFYTKTMFDYREVEVSMAKFGIYITLFAAAILSVRMHLRLI
jgi:hypothetical protein